MTDINVSNISVPRIPRNKRIYSEYKSERISIGAPSEFVDTQRNVQADILRFDNGDFTGREVSVNFITPFTFRPVGFVNVYRYEARSGGGNYYSNVMYYVENSDWITNLGFTINIEDFENLNGVFIEYSFTEKTNENE